jgi:hypothetical protein
MNQPKINLTLYNKDFSISDCLYAYKGTRIRFKKYLILPLIGFVFLSISRLFANSYIVFNSIKVHTLSDGSTYLQYGATKWISQLFDFFSIFTIILFIILLIPRTWIINLKLKTTDKNILLYKTIHKDEAEQIVFDINSIIKEKRQTTYP